MMPNSGASLWLRENVGSAAISTSHFVKLGSARIRTCRGTGQTTCQALQRTAVPFLMGELCQSSLRILGLLLQVPGMGRQSHIAHEVSWQHNRTCEPSVGACPRPYQQTLRTGLAGGACRE